MDPLQHAPNPAHHEHLLAARRVLELPIEVSRLHWHPFGLYTIPLAKRREDETDGGRIWSRRLHIWHPLATPVGEASPYGVHTHTGTAASHVLVGTLHHHLYDFEPDADGIWQRAALGVPEGRATLRGHLQAPTVAGQTHTLPAHQPHGVSKPPGFAMSLFEQLDEPKNPGHAAEFTTWQRTDVPAEPLLKTGPVPLAAVQREALLVVDAAIATLA